MYKLTKKLNILQNYHLFFISVLVLFFFSFTSIVYAITPTLSISTTGDGDSVQLTINGDANSAISLFYTRSGYGQQISPIGTTNSNGILTTTISSSNYGIASGTSVHITSGNINGPQSSNVLWPNVSSSLSSSNMLTLSQTGVVLAVGQTSIVNASNLNSSSLYLASNSNPVIANINISGSQISILANSYGSTVASICLINNTSNCGSIYINVQNSNAQPLTFSQNTVSMYSGQVIAIQISGGSGAYQVLSNSTQNQGIVGTSISGSTITLTTSSTTGSSSITVCSTNMNSCGIINVTIGNNINTSAITFSQSSPTVTVGQSLNVSIYGPSNSLFYVSSNSNPNIVQANLSGSTLTLLGINTGTSTIKICSSTSNCGSLTTNVNYDSNSNGAKLTLSQDSIYLTIGQTSTITVSGGSMPYNILANTNDIFQPSLNVNILSLYGIRAGSSLMNVCSASGNCATLSVTVSSAGSAPALPLGCTSTSGYSPTTGLPCNENIVNNTKNTTTNNTNSSYKFTKPMKVGSSGKEVIELQKKLKTLGYYNGSIDGSFGTGTEKAVKAYQKAQKLQQVGNVGPSTRAALNK